MRRKLLPVLTVITSLIGISPSAAQTLSSRPAIFRDPLLGTDPAYGELVLGQTTLLSALRIFAADLEDSVLVPRGHPSNPDTVWSTTQIAPSITSKPHHRLDLGSGRYTLYFDKNERLVAALTHGSRLPRRPRREELVARYPTLRVDHVGRTAEGAWVKDDLVASLGPCVSLVADVWRKDKGLLGTFGYVFTCPTKPAPQMAQLDKEP